MGCVDGIRVLAPRDRQTLLVGVEGVEPLDVSVTVVATAGLCSSLLTD